MIEKTSSTQNAGQPNPAPSPTADKTAHSGIPLPFVRWRGFTIQMYLFIVLPLVVLLLVITFGSQTLHHEAMRSLVGERDLRAVRAAANSLSHEISNRATTLQLFAHEVAAAPNTAALLDQANLPGFDGGLFLLSADGKVISASSGAIAPHPNLAATLLPLGSAQPAAFSDPVQGSDGAWWQMVVTRTPAGERLVGVFSPAALVRSSLTGVTTGQTTVLLLSPGGDVLYLYGMYAHTMPIRQHPGVPEVLRGESGVNYSPPEKTPPMAGMDHAGEHVVAFTPVAPLGWGLVMEEPWQATASPLLSATQTAPLVLAPVVVLAVLALWFGARQIVQPLQALENRAGRLASGDFAAIRTPVGGISEIQNLQAELVEMAGALDSAQEALHSYIGALTAGLETERRSLARELHDDTLQSLIALNQNIQMALLRTSGPQQQAEGQPAGADARQAEPDHRQAPGMRQALLDLQARTGETITSLRRAIGGLRPIYLEDLGLSAALAMLAKDADGQGHASQETAAPRPLVTYQALGVERRLTPEAELAFYRIAQEALNNAIRHAGPSRVEITLAFEPAFTRLTIRDDGCGFTVPPDPGAFAHSGHYGLLGMHERADLVEAMIQLESMPGKGTRLTVTLADREAA